MDDPIRDYAAGRDKIAYDASHVAASNASAVAPATPCDRPNGDTAPATHLSEPGADAEPIVICSWCLGLNVLHILKMARREQDVVVIYWQGKELRILRNGINLRISHGICVPCRERFTSDVRTGKVRP